MHSGFTAHVSSAEWRWVILVSLGLVVLALSPLALVAINGASASDWQFMGILHNPRDGATYLSKMMLGVQGELLVRFQHTPEPHNSAFIQALYPLLGQLAALTNAPVLLVFHTVRAAAAVFMYLALYQLAATIWMRIRTRRIFFALVALGSGFGWIYTILTNGATDSPDLSIPEAFPFYSSLVNIHFPLAIACLSLLVGIIIEVFRPGVNEEPNVGNNGLAAVFLSLLLAVLYPQSLIPLLAALGLFCLLRWWSKKRIILRESSWLLVIGLPVLPLAAYYAAIVTYNPAMAEWASQNVTTAPPIWVLLLGFGLPLLIAGPGIWQALRQFEAHDDRFMLFWLLAMLVAIYLPTPIQRRFAVGMMIPVAYFATRAVESIWFQWLSQRRWRYRILVILLPILALTHLFVLFVPTLPVLVQRLDQTQGLFLERDYTAVYNWLAENASADQVVLAAEDVSMWLPGLTSARTVYGHVFETLEYDAKANQVSAWYGSGENCQSLLDSYGVDYVIYGPEEEKMGDAPCLGDLREVTRSGEVTLYAP